MSHASSFHIAGTRLDALRIDEAVQKVATWARMDSGIRRTVSLVNAWSIVCASRDSEFQRVLNASDLCIVDGVPVAWLGQRLLGAPCERLSGPDLMHTLLSEPPYGDLTHFVYGGDEASLTRLSFRYNRGGIIRPKRILGTYSPPHRELSSEEEDEIISRIQRLEPQVLWVCLGTARQEKWISRIRNSLHVPVIVGVGAAVDFLSGNKSRAPRWMQRIGLEWLYRLATEPRRLWRRYLVGNMIFISLARIELRRRRAEQGS